VTITHDLSSVCHCIACDSCLHIFIQLTTRALISAVVSTRIFNITLIDKTSNINVTLSYSTTSMFVLAIKRTRDDKEVLKARFVLGGHREYENVQSCIIARP
jgi:hypothetical protein